MYRLRKCYGSYRSIASRCSSINESKNIFAKCSNVNVVISNCSHFGIVNCSRSFSTSDTFYSTSTSKDAESGPLPPAKEQPEPEKKASRSYKLQMKQAIKDYGVTVIVFHVTISLASLGICYLGVSNGLDVSRLMSFLGFSEKVISNTFVAGGSTFVISYAVHKLFAPVRIATTLTATPFIVRYLRKIGFLKVKTVSKP